MFIALCLQVSILLDDISDNTDAYLGLGLGLGLVPGLGVRGKGFGPGSGLRGAGAGSAEGLNHIFGHLS